MNIRANTVPRAADLIRGIERSEADHANAAALAAALNASLAVLVENPTEFERVGRRADDATRQAERLSAVVALMRRQLPEAQKREAQEQYAAQAAKLEADTVRLSRNLERRYVAASEALAGVLDEMVANERAWTALRHASDAVGVARHPGGHHAEFRARRLEGAGIFYSLTTHAVIPGWQGRELFERKNASR